MTRDAVPASATPGPRPGSDEPTDAPRPLRADAERNRRRLVAAAREVFATRGVDVTLDDVAHHAGVGVGTAYRRFANKDELIEAVFEEQVQRIVDVGNEALGMADSWDGVVHFLVTAGGEMAGDRGLQEVFLRRSHSEDRLAQARDRLMPVTHAIIERARRDGHLRADIEGTDFPVFQHMLGAVTTLSRDVRPELWRRYLTILLDGLRPARAGVSPLPEPAPAPTELESMLGVRAP